MKNGTVGSVVALSLALSLALSGCAAKTKGASPASASPRAAALAEATAVAPATSSAVTASPAPTLFGALFHSGRVFRYAVESERSFYDPEDPTANEAGYVSAKETTQILCAVSDVRDVPAGRASKLDCGAEGNAIGMTGATIAGVYVLGKKGLYRFGVDTKSDEIPEELPQDAFVLASEPVADKKSEEVEEHASFLEVKRGDDGGWCTELEELYGDIFATADCFTPGRGIVRARRETSGGSTYVTTFTAI